MKKDLPAGTIFSMEVDDNHVGYGQITRRNPQGKGYDYNMIVFKELYPKDFEVSVEEIVSGEIAFAPLPDITSMMFNYRYFVPVGWAEPLWEAPDMYWWGGLGGKYTYFKYGVGVLSSPSAQEQQRAIPRSSIMDSTLLRALQALHGLREWNDHHKNMLLLSDEETTNLRNAKSHVNCTAAKIEYTKARKTKPSSKNTSKSQEPPCSGELLSNESQDPVSPPEEHALITHLPLSEESYGAAEDREAVRDLEGRLEKLVEEFGGTHDGNEFGNGEAILYTYGPDANKLYDALLVALEGYTVREGAYTLKRYGENSDSETVKVPLS